MEINVLLFGQLTDVTGESCIKITEVTDTAELVQQLGKNYPGLKSLEYSIAVNKEIVGQNRLLKDNDEVALLPPFSGG